MAFSAVRRDCKRGGVALRSCAAYAAASALHHRMPVIPELRDWGKW